ncbi:lysophospholipid acyltransferase family protein [Hoeflea ulvae]|uniref:Lysophospholipid acyltransferase family protein n=1 Tax=Hoeflea ulvae TaxID=2983764 RepID=A0ABT3YKE5_9HYPH|nr:lysophospholipid acyltransferase family protein [Hoeflea ulvae]MCY0096370.1 lysophospholipid acyltransferase family protein [Hoeflea ulvae]
MAKQQGSTGNRWPALTLAEVPFAETCPQEPAAPPFHDIWAKQSDRRASARLYWLKQPVEGRVNQISHALFRLLPCDLGSDLACRLSRLAHWRYRNRIFAKRISSNLQRLAPERCGTPERHRAALLSWWSNIGRSIAEFSVVNQLWPKGRITVEGADNLAAARAQGGPLIFVSIHLSTWEAIFAAAQQGIAPPNIGPFQPEPSRFTNRIVHDSRRRRNQYIFPPGQRSAFRLQRLLAGGGAASMTIFIDEVRARQVHLPLFGRAPPDKGNAVVAIKLANSTGGTLVPVYLKRTSGARFTLCVLPPLARTEDAERSYPVDATIAQFNDIFEPLVIDNIEHWYMLGELRLPQP